MATPGTLTSTWLGVDAMTVRTSGGSGDVRVAFSTSSAMTAPVYSAPASPDSDGTTKHTIPAALARATAHWYQVEHAGVLIGTPTQFRTLPAAGTPASFRFAYGSCRQHGTVTLPAISHALARNPALFLEIGDIHYRNYNTTDEAQYLSAFDELHVSSSAFRQLLQTVPIAYTWDDHDTCGDGTHAGSTGIPAVRTAYRRRVPHPTLPSTQGGIYHTFRVGRVRFIVLDTRSLRTSHSVADGPSKTMLGAEQKAWLKGWLAAPDTPLTFIVSSVGWIGAGGGGVDHWGAYRTERAEIGGWIAASSTKVVFLCGDAHMLAYDDGTNAVGEVPVLQAAAIHQSASEKGGPYSGGTNPGTDQYAYVDIADDGATIGLTWTGVLSSGATWKTFTVSYGPGGSNLPPAADAGPDQTVEPWATVTLTGSDADTDGTIASRAWAQTAGPAVTLTGSGQSRTFEAPATIAGSSLTFRYTVTDNGGATAFDDVTVTVLPVTERAVIGGVEVPMRVRAY